MILELSAAELVIIFASFVILRGERFASLTSRCDEVPVSRSLGASLFTTGVSDWLLVCPHHTPPPIGNHLYLFVSWHGTLSSDAGLSSLCLTSNRNFFLSLYCLEEIISTLP